MNNMRVLKIGCLSLVIMNFLAILLFFGYVYIRSTYGAVGVYCFEGHKCFTVWNRPGSEVYVIAGEWRKRTFLNDDYLWLYISDYEVDRYVSIILAKDSSLIVNFSEAIDCYRYRSRSGALKLYRDNVSYYDSLYTQPSGAYREYRPEVCWMTIDVVGPRLMWGRCVEKIED